jgi:hypothetical protein
MSKGYKCVIFISDLHIPFHHRDSFHFIKAVIDKFTVKDSTRVIFSGDEVDWASVSYHEKNSDLPSPSYEMLESIVYLQELYKIIPVATILESNHGSLLKRKIQSAGLPSKVLRSYNEIFEAPQSWVWVHDCTVRLSNGRLLYCHHGLSKNALANSKTKSMNYIQGHFHSEFSIQYWNNGNKLFWSATASCLVDPEHIAFNYGKNSLMKPILGLVVIIEGHPRLIPMVLDKHKRWIGRLV